MPSKTRDGEPLPARYGIHATPFEPRDGEPRPERDGIPAMPSSDLDRGSGIGRRGFLGLATRAVLWVTGGASAIALSRYLSYQPPAPESSRFTLEMQAGYPVDTMTVVAAAGAALYRDARGFFARSLTCGHLGCRVRPAEDGGFACPCHGSRFARFGNRVHGPAARDLVGVALSLDKEGRLVVDMSTRVDDSWRLAPTAIPLALQTGSFAGSGE